jgi:hypothetical protein
MKLDIIKAIHDPDLFRPYVTGDPDGDLGSWKNWLTFLKVLYGLRLTKGEHEIVRLCTGRDPLKFSREGYTEALVLCGRRSGKSRTTALVGAAEAVLSGKEKALSKGEIPMVAILSPTRFQSRIIHSYLKGVFQSTPLLQGEVAEERRESFALKNGVEIAIVTGSPQACRGFSVISCIVDEVCAFGLSSDEGGTYIRSDTELIRALRPSLASTGGRLLCVSTPFKAAGYGYQTWKRAYGNDDCDVLCWNAPSLVMNLTLSPKVVERAIAEDSIAASVEYAVRPGLFREDLEVYISRAVVEALVVPGRKELPPRGGIAYAAFVDVSGGRHDDAALAIAHKEDRMVILDCLERYKSPHSPYDVVAKMVMTLRRYFLDRAISDAYAAEWTRIAFASHGINLKNCSTSVWKELSAGHSLSGTSARVAVAKPKSVLYAELLPRLTSGEVELLDSDILVNQLCSLQRRTRSGGRDQIDHPPGQGFKDDCANVLAGVCDAVQQRQIVAGALGAGGSAGGMVVGAIGPRPQGMTPLEAALAAANRRQQERERERQMLEAMGDDSNCAPPGWQRAMRFLGRG